MKVSVCITTFNEKKETIEYLNSYLRKLNESGTLFVEHKKCNFDVEIGKVVIFATARRVSSELSATKAPIFDIQKIKQKGLLEEPLSHEFDRFRPVLFYS